LLFSLSLIFFVAQINSISLVPIATDYLQYLFLSPSSSSLQSGMRRTVFCRAPITPPQWAKGLLSWNPVRVGEFLQDIPKKFDKAHAKHFAVVESASIVPVFALSVVHYFSMYTQYPDRAALLPKLQQEAAEKTNSIKFWLDNFARHNAAESIPWRIGLLGMQVVTFPLWLLVASASPAVVHSTLLRIDHIMSSKYQCISNSAPAFVAQHAKSTELSEDFHRTLTHVPTDFGAAAFLLLLIWYLTL
jgi:hypothetical protein